MVVASVYVGMEAKQNFDDVVTSRLRGVVQSRHAIGCGRPRQFGGAFQQCCGVCRLAEIGASEDIDLGSVIQQKVDRRLVAKQRGRVQRWKPGLVALVDRFWISCIRRLHRLQVLSGHQFVHVAHRRLLAASFRR